MSVADRQNLLILGCSQKKRDYEGLLPAFEAYDGPMYKVFRKFLRQHKWPENLWLGVLSGKHELFGGLKEINYYDRRMTREDAEIMASRCSDVIGKWSTSIEASNGISEDSSTSHDLRILVSLGKDYFPAIEPGLEKLQRDVNRFEGGIGEKQHRLKNFLDGLSSEPRQSPSSIPHPERIRLSYFLPDWDDTLDPDFDFDNDEFSNLHKSKRKEVHCQKLLGNRKICDGILVSLAQKQDTKGPLKRLDSTETAALRPKPLRSHYGLREDQLLFGDCGAYSYVLEDEPAFSTEQAVALYELYEFDFGTSVDHIPFADFPDDKRRSRVETTLANAEAFIRECSRRGNLFNPVGAVQGLSAEEYAENVKKYYEMGYRHMALGGLVRLKDSAVLEIVKEVSEAAGQLPERPWIHLFGVFRPKLQPKFKELKIDSFDSATYFRKSWLRSDQNYLCTKGNWYAAIRVPITKDPRTRKRLAESGADLEEMKKQEQQVLKLLKDYGDGKADLTETLNAVIGYDEQLLRSSETKSMRKKYERTLREKPWLQCGCGFCQELGIQVLIFRGSNRNKRRGTHNTAMLFEKLNDNR